MAGGCAPSRGPGSPEPADRCRIGAPTVFGLVPQPLAIVVAEPGGGQADDSPAAWFDRLLLRQQYATLVVVDCEGGIVAGAADHWTSDRAGRSWTFTLRPGQQFADGSALDAPAVAANWQRDRSDSTRWPGVTALTVLGPDRLRVELALPLADPGLFFDPGFALGGPATSEGTSLASGTHGRVGVPAPTLPPGGQRIMLEPNRLFPDRPPLDVELLPRGTDHRDLLDVRRASPRPVSGMHLTRDPRAVSYAQAVGEWRAIPLAWDRTYVLTVRTAEGTGSRPAEAELAAMARDVVPGDARAAAGPFWWRQDENCLLAAPPMLPVGRQVAYDRTDAVARALAERIVALAVAGDAQPWLPGALRSAPAGPDQARAVPMDPVALRRGIMAGTVVAAVTAVPALRRPGCAGAPPRLTGGVEIPLVQTRGWALVRGALPPIVLLGDGTFLLTGAVR